MDVLMPQLGETVKEGAVSTWFKKVGDMVAAGEDLFEIETDKVSMEVQAIESGILAEIRVAAGETCKVGEVVAVIGDKVAATPKPERPKSITLVRKNPPFPEKTAPASVPATDAARAAGTLRERGFAPFNEVFTPAHNYGSAKTSDGVRVTPLARRLIAQNNLDANAIAAKVRASGRSRVGAEDVQAALVAPSAARAPIAIGDNREIVPLSRVRAQTAKHLQNAWQTVPHVFQAVEIDFGAVSAVRDARKEGFHAERGAPLTFLAFISRAACLALRAFPKINAAFDGEKLHISRDIHLGIAVDLGHEGLVVPAIRHTDGLNVAGLAMAIHAIAEKARAGKLTPADMDGGTYSISNNGSFGTLFTAPIINAPQAAILSTDAIRKRAIVKETEYGDVIVSRPVGIVAQSFDHRAFDGAYSAAFLAHLKEIIETRDWASEF